MQDGKFWRSSLQVIIQAFLTIDSHNLYCQSSIHYFFHLAGPFIGADVDYSVKQTC